jgi:hypothetical protein
MAFSNPVIGVRITGATDAAGRVHKFRITTLQRLREAAQARAREARDHIRGEMAAEYTSREASGRLARSVVYRTQLIDNGVSVSLLIGGYRELSYVTALGGGYFTLFPVGPFVITPRFKRMLRIQFSDGIVYTKAVLWGSETGGFSRDVLADVASVEMADFQSDMLRVVDDAIVELTVE